MHYVLWISRIETLYWFPLNDDCSINNEERTKVELESIYIHVNM